MKSIFPETLGHETSVVTARQLPSVSVSSQEDDISLPELWRVVRRRRWLLLATTLAFLALAVCYCLLVKPKYTSVARLALDPDKANSLNMEDLGIGVPGASDAQSKLETEARVLQSNSLAIDVIKKLKLDHNPLFYRNSNGKDISDPLTRSALLGAWKADIVVKPIPKTNLIELSFRSKSPELSATVVNSLLEAYVERNFRVKYEGAMQASDWLGSQLSDIEKNSKESEHRLTDYQRQSGILVWGGEDNPESEVTNKLGELGKSYTTAKAERVVKEARYRIASSDNPELLANVEEGGALSTLATQEVDLNNQYAQATAKFGAAYPKVRQLKAQLLQVQEAEKEQVGKVKQRFESEFHAAQRTETMLAGELEKTKTEAYKFNEGAAQLQILQREAQSNRELYESILKKLKEAGVLAGLRSTNSNVVDYGLVELSPSEPKVVPIIAFALIGGLCFGLVGAFVLETFDDTLASTEELEKYTALPSLAVIPIIAGQRMTRRALKGQTRKKPDEELSITAMSHPKSHAAESFRTLRTSLLLSRSGPPPKIIALTSTFPGDGKSTISINLAIVLAEKTAKVLLIDGDMRRSSLHQRLGVRALPGLSALLTGSATDDEAIVPVEKVPGLFLLPSGVTPPYPAELLGSPTMHEALARFSEKFDFILIDTPPVLSFTDAVVVSTVADCTIMVVRAGVTGRHALLRARDVLQRANAHIVGVALNAVDLKSASYYYGYKKYDKYYEDSENPEN